MQSLTEVYTQDFTEEDFLCLSEGSKQIDKMLGVLNSEIREQRAKVEEMQKTEETVKKALRLTIRQATSN